MGNHQYHGNGWSGGLPGASGHDGYTLGLVAVGQSLGDRGRYMDEECILFTNL